MSNNQIIEIKKDVNIDFIKDFFRQFPEEKMGRKNFLEKEKFIMKEKIYFELFCKANKENAKAIGNIKEKYKNKKLSVRAILYDNK